MIGAVANSVEERKRGTTTGFAIAAARQDETARAALFERIIERMHRYFARMVRDPGEAEECLQRALIELDRTIQDGSYDPGRSFNAWMWLKARTVWAQWCREREKRPQTLPAEDVAIGARAGAGSPSVERRLDAVTVLEEVARRLGDEWREAFLLYYEGDLTLEEVAETLGRDRKTVTKRIQEAHELIDRLLGQDVRKTTP